MAPSGRRSICPTRKKGSTAARASTGRVSSSACNTKGSIFTDRGSTGRRQTFEILFTTVRTLSPGRAVPSPAPPTNFALSALTKRSQAARLSKSAWALSGGPTMPSTATTGCMRSPTGASGPSGKAAISSNSRSSSRMPHPGTATRTARSCALFPASRRWFWNTV